MKIALVTIMLVAFAASANAAPSPEELYAHGKAANDKGDYATAIADWQASYKLSGAPLLLFNLAQAYRLGGDCKQALSTYRRFLAVDPKSDQHNLANEFVLELELEPLCGRTPIAPTASATDDHPGRTKEIAGVAAGGAGVILLVTGIALGHHASTIGGDVTHTCATGCDWATEQPVNTSGTRDAALGVTFDVLGAAAIVGGAVLYYLGSRDSEVGIAPTAAAVPHASGAVLSWSTTW